MQNVCRLCCVVFVLLRDSVAVGGNLVLTFFQVNSFYPCLTHQAAACVCVSLLHMCVACHHAVRETMSGEADVGELSLCGRLKPVVTCDMHVHLLC